MTTQMNTQVPPTTPPKPPKVPIHKTVLHAFCILLWIVMFCSGIIIGTKFYRTQLSDGLGDWQWQLYCFIIMFFNYSMSNIAILCCLAALIGGMTHSDPENVVQLFGKGLAVYFVVLGSSLIIGADPFSEVTQAHYIRTAILSSGISFLIGYYPEKFATLLSQISGRFTVSDDQPKQG